MDMNIVDKLLNLGVVRIDFDDKIERSAFEIEYLMNQKKIIYYFFDFEEWNDEKNTKNLVYQLNFFVTTQAS